MKYFKHYKNKPYRVHGVAKHSETLEDHVIYECLYENKLATMWIRPKDMFYGSLELDGKTTTRFAKIPLEIQTLTEVTPSTAKELEPVLLACFADLKSEKLTERLGKEATPVLLVARIDGKAVGYKVGYSKGTGKFYSWRGGVLPEFRRLGIATDLLQAQESWCRKQGFNSILTKTRAQNSEMLLFTIGAGYKIVSTEVHPERGLMVCLEKSLKI